MLQHVAESLRHLLDPLLGPFSKIVFAERPKECIEGCKAGSWIVSELGNGQSVELFTLGFAELQPT